MTKHNEEQTYKQREIALLAFNLHEIRKKSKQIPFKYMYIQNIITRLKPLTKINVLYI